MLSLCYVSAAFKRMSDAELTDLLQNSRRYNTHKGLTGLLLYNGVGTFLQVLQGPAAEVEALYQKIGKDTRHHRVNCIGRKSIAQSDFPNWSMGFKTFDSTALRSLEGFSNFLELNTDEGLEYLQDNTSFTYSILSHFKKTITRQVL